VTARAKKKDAFTIVGGKPGAPVEERLAELRAMAEALTPVQRDALIQVYANHLAQGRTTVVRIATQPWRALVEARLLDNNSGLSIYHPRLDGDESHLTEHTVDFVKPSRRGALVVIGEIFRDLLTDGSPLVKYLILETAAAVLTDELRRHQAAHVAEDIEAAIGGAR